MSRCFQASIFRSRSNTREEFCCIAARAGGAHSSGNKGSWSDLCGKRYCGYRMTSGKIRACIDCMWLIASRTKFAHSLKLSLRIMSALPPNSRLCACTPPLRDWRVRSATATPMMTYAARPLSGIPLTCERCSRRLLLSCSVAAF